MSASAASLMSVASAAGAELQEARSHEEPRSNTPLEQQQEDGAWNGEGAAGGSVSGGASSSSVVRPRTLVHFKQGAAHAVSRALHQLAWTEIRIKLPKSKENKESEGDDEENEGGAAGTAAAADDAAASSSSRADMLPVHSARKKVKQPRSLLLNLASYPATIVTVAGVPAPAAAAARRVPRALSSSSASAAAPLQWDVAWVDLLSEREYASVGPLQRLNQFPHMHKLSKKKFLALHLNAMREHEPDEYAFYPRSWVLPAQRAQLEQYYAEVDAATAMAAASSSAAVAAASPSPASPAPFPASSPPSASSSSSSPSASPSPSSPSPSPSPVLIVKPDFACEGRGIYLVSRLGEVESSREHPVVVQQYVGNPLLINGCKYDLRLYVLVLSVQPLSICLFDEGLTRVCAEAYVEPSVGSLGSAFQHLTNYALNKSHKDFVTNDTPGVEDEGHKWSLQALFARLRDVDGVDIAALWRSISEVVLKSVLASYGSLLHSYRSAVTGGSANDDGGACFQLLGFDILLVHGEDVSTGTRSRQPRPVLIEINRNCSLRCETPLDARVKTKVVAQTLQLADPRAPYRLRHSGKEAASRTREKLRGLSGREYKDAQAEMQQARVKARLEYEDDMLRKFAEQEGGGFHRIYPIAPAVAPAAAANAAASAAAADGGSAETTAAAAPHSSPFRTTLMPLPDRAAAFERLMSLSMRLHSEGKSNTKATPTAGSARAATAAPVSATAAAAAASVATKASSSAAASAPRRALSGRPAASANASSSVRAARAAANRAAAAAAASANAAALVAAESAAS